MTGTPEPGVPVRLLLVEDSENDAMLLPRELRRGGYEPNHERLYTPEGMERALREIRDAERNRIARELHDSILQDIVYALQEIQVLQVTHQNGLEPALGGAADALRR